MFLPFCNVLHNVPFYRGITCIYIYGIYIYMEYVEESAMFHFFLCFVFFVMLYIIFHVYPIFGSILASPVSWPNIQGSARIEETKIRAMHGRRGMFTERRHCHSDTLGS